ncbi:MAG: glycosyltransferase, partial [Actinomycetota bacterium]|nr:glycosyltransferase [Actinomycetota bacterium]
TGLPERVDHRSADLAALQQYLRSRGSRADLAGFFDLWEEIVTRRGPQDPAFAFPGPLAREIVHWLDRVALSPSQVRRHLAISRTVATRPGYFPKEAHVGVVHPPSNLEGLHCGRFKYFFTASRLDHPKRVDLLIEAMRHVDAPTRLKIAGTGPDEGRLRARASGDERIEFVGHVTSEQLVGLYADALAVAFVPADEDLGLVTLEAMCSGKPVVTTRDAGGPTELVQHGRTGFVMQPTPGALGWALQRLAGDPRAAREMGRIGTEMARQVTWDRVLSRLLQPVARHGGFPARRPGRTRIVVASTYVVHPPRGGGQIRSAKLYGALADRYDVELVSLADHQQPARQTVVAPGVAETVIPKSAEQDRFEHDRSRAVGWIPVTDIVAAMRIDLTPAYVDALHRAAVDAGAIVLAHPYLEPAVRMAGLRLPVVYDAHNVEADLKGRALPSGPAGTELQARVEEVERAAVERAALVTATTSSDAAGLARRYGIGVHDVVVVPNGVDVAGTPFVAGEARSSARASWLRRHAGLAGGRAAEHLAIFLGSWHPPNLEAAEVVLHCAARLPHTLFLLVGSHADYYRKWDVPPNAVLVGVVGNEAKRSLLAAADVALNPMLSGSGSNLKILEYFAAGVPVVSSRFGARGTAAEAGTHYVPAGLDTFVGTLAELLASGPPAGLQRAARELAETYDWVRIGRMFTDAVASLLPSGSAPAGVYAQLGQTSSDAIGVGDR